MKLKSLKLMEGKKMIKLDDMYVKEIVKTTKDKDDGIEVTHKATLEMVGDSDIKVAITSADPIKLVQGDKGIKITIETTQKTLTPGK